MLMNPSQKETDVSTTATGISQIQLVMFPSTDQDRSVAFYEALGFEKRSDIPWGDGYRWQHAADRRAGLTIRGI